MKQFVLFLSLCFANIALADSYQTVIFNLNDKYDVTATYQVCSYNIQNQELCDPEKSILIKAKKISEDKNYVVIKQPTEDPNIQNVNLKIISAIEKDDKGNVVAKGKYFDESKHLTSNCIGELYMADSTYDHIGDTELLLNDIHGSPYITCEETFFVADDN